MGDTGGQRVDSAKVTGELLYLFLRDVRWIALLWLGMAVVLTAFGVVSGEMSVRESAAFTVGLLPLAVALSPLVWLRHEIVARGCAALPAIGLAILWFIVLSPPAILLGAWLSRFVGGD